MFRGLLNLIRPARMSVVSVCVPSHDYRKQPEWWKFWDDPTRAVTGWAGCQRPPYTSPPPGFWFSPPNLGGIWRWSSFSRSPQRGRFWLSLTSVGDLWIRSQEHYFGAALASRTLSQNVAILCFPELYLHQSMKSKTRNPQISLDVPVLSRTEDMSAETKIHTCMQ